jgi:hypothetical protein
MAPPPKPLNGVTQQVEETLPVAIIYEDIVATIPPRGHMIDPAGEFHA